MRLVLFFRFFLLSLTDVLKQQADATASELAVQRGSPVLCATLLCFYCSQSPSLLGWVRRLELEKDVMSVLTRRGKVQVLSF